MNKQINSEADNNLPTGYCHAALKFHLPIQHYMHILNALSQNQYRFLC